MPHLLTPDDKGRLERIDERTINMVRSLQEHVNEDLRRFDRLFGFTEDQFAKMYGRFDDMDKKMDTLWDDKNHRSGALAASRLIVVGTWAVVGLLAGLFMSVKAIQ